MTPTTAPSRNSGTPSTVRWPATVIAVGSAYFRVGGDVRDVHGPAFECHPPGDPFAAGRNSSFAQDFPILVAVAITRQVAKDLAVAHDDGCGVAAAQPRRRRDHRVEHRLQVERRTADNLEHVAGRGLVFERFFEVACALAQFAEQPRVLGRDRGLPPQRRLVFGFAFGKLKLQLGDDLLGIG
jgi:hypothetical protein